MKWFGLTGGIATGKSTVSRMLEQEGVHVIDADVIAREVVQPGSPALSAIVEAFGTDVLRDDGSLDRDAVGARVFGDPEQRARLNAIVHPAIAARTAELLGECRDRGLPLVVYDAALIVENSIHRVLDGLIVVHVPTELQIERLVARDGLDPEQAQERLDAQMPQEEKIAVADWTIDNSGELEATRRRVREVVAELRERAAG